MQEEQAPVNQQVKKKEPKEEQAPVNQQMKKRRGEDHPHKGSRPED